MSKLNDTREKEGDKQVTPCAQTETISKIFTQLGSVEKQQAKQDGQFTQFLSQMADFFTNYREDMSSIRIEITNLSSSVTKILAHSDITVNKNDDGVRISMVPKKSFWDTEAGKNMPKWIAITIIGIVLVLSISLVGTNWIEFFKQNGGLLKTIK